jgi:excisionase family DNA binding protein
VTMLTARAVAEKLDCSVQQVYRLIAEGELQAVKIGKRGVRVTLAAFDRFVRQGGCRACSYGNRAFAMLVPVE